MKILLANYRYFISGGPERYMFNLLSQLEKQQHEIIPFSIDYSQNLTSKYKKYFVSPIGKKEQIYYDQHSKSLSILLKTISRLFYSNEVEKAVSRIIEATTPDVAYVLHYLRKLSPSLLVGLKKKNIPIIVRLSDYAMICPQGHCIKNDLSCTLCIHGALLPSITNRCLKNSLPISMLNALATIYHRSKRYFDLIDNYVCTNMYMYKMMLDAGYPDNKLTCIPTFTDISHFKPANEYKKSNYIVYSGRLDHLKGIHVLINALGMLKNKEFKNIQLKIAGTGDFRYVQQCEEMVKKNGLRTHIEFLGNIDSIQLATLLSKAIFSVVPSLWFENLPNVIIESYACGTPVIASNIGSLSDCIHDYKTGFLFKPGDSEDLAKKVSFCLDNENLLHNMALNARREAEAKYAPSVHIESLLNLFKKYIHKKNGRSF